MTERVEEIAPYKMRALTGELHRLGAAIERWNGELKTIRMHHRSATDSFESVRRRTRETCTVSDPRLGRFYLEALRARLTRERGAVRRLEDRLREGEQRVSLAQSDLSTTLGRLKRLEERTRDSRVRGFAEQERRAEANTQELWHSPSPIKEEYERVDGCSEQAADNKPETEALPHYSPAVSSVGNPCEDPGGCDFGVRPQGRLNSERTYAEESSNTHLSPNLPSLAVTTGRHAERPDGRLRNPKGEPQALQARSPNREGAIHQREHGVVTSMAGRSDGGLSLTYRGGSGNVIEVGIARTSSGAIDLAFTAERPSDRYRLERERRALIDSLRERGYTVGRFAIGAPGQEVHRERMR